MLAGKEYVHSKLRENQERVKELKKVVNDLQIPQSYENSLQSIDFEKNLMQLLISKTNKFSKYVDNNLRQNNLMVDQMPSVVKKLNINLKKQLVETSPIKRDHQKNKNHQQANQIDDVEDKKGHQTEKQIDQFQNQTNNQVQDIKYQQNEQKGNDNKLDAKTDINQDKSQPKLAPILIPLPASPNSKKKSNQQQQINIQKIDPYLIKLDQIDEVKIPRNIKLERVQHKINQYKEKLQQLKETQISLNKQLQDKRQANQANNLTLPLQQDNQKPKKRSSRNKRRREMRKASHRLASTFGSDSIKDAVNQQQPIDAKSSYPQELVQLTKEDDLEGISKHDEPPYIIEPKQDSIEHSPLRTDQLTNDQNQTIYKNSQIQEPDKNSHQQNLDKIGENNKKENDQNSDKNHETDVKIDNNQEGIVQKSKQGDLQTISVKDLSGEPRSDPHKINEGKNEQTSDDEGVQEEDEEDQILLDQIEDNDELIFEYNQAIEKLTHELQNPFKPIPHPIYAKILEVQNQINQLKSIIDNENYEKYAHQDLCFLHQKEIYRKKIKGFHRAFNVKDSLDEKPKSKYQYQIQGTAEELRLSALDRKNQRLYRKQMANLEKEEKYRKDRLRIRLMADQMRRQKQEQIMKITEDLRLENPSQMLAALSVEPSPAIVAPTSIAFLSDPKNYQAIKDKQAQLNKELTINQQRTRMAELENKDKERLSKQQNYQKEIDEQIIEKQKARERNQRVQAIESIVLKPDFTFVDLDKLDFHDINAVSHKYGEAEFNPQDFLDLKDEGSEESSGDEVIKRFRKNKIPPNQDLLESNSRNSKVKATINQSPPRTNKSPLGSILTDKRINKIQNNSMNMQMNQLSNYGDVAQPANHQQQNYIPTYSDNRQLQQYREHQKIANYSVGVSGSGLGMQVHKDYPTTDISQSSPISRLQRKNSGLTQHNRQQDAIQSLQMPMLSPQQKRSKTKIQQTDLHNPIQNIYGYQQINKHNALKNQLKGNQSQISLQNHTRRLHNISPQKNYQIRHNSTLHPSAAVPQNRSGHPNRI